MRESLTTKDKSKLVPVQKIVIRNGKPHVQTYYVSPAEASTMGGMVTFQNRDQFRQYIKKLSTEQRKEIMEQALNAGITWKRQEVWKTDWMRCAMAIGSHLDKQGKFVITPFSVNKKTTPKKELPKEKQTEKNPKEQATDVKSKPKSEPKKEETKTESDVPKINQLFDKLGLPNREDDEGNFIIGQGMKTVTNKFGYPEPAPGHLRMVDIGKKERFGEGNWIKLDSCFFDKDKLKTEFGARFDPEDKKWYIPLKEFARVSAEFKNVEISSRIAPVMKAVVEKVDIDKLAELVRTPKAGQSTNRITNEVDIDISDFKLPKGMVEKNPFNPSEKFDLYDHQKKAVKFAITNQKAMIGLAVGLGKTLTAITGIREVINRGEAKRAVVVAPSSVKFNWKNEIEQFSNLKAQVIESSDLRKNGEQVWKDARKSDVIIVNYEMLRKEEVREQLQKLAPNLVVVDEAHKLKNDTKQTKGFTDTWKDAKYKWFLTATPFPNGQPRETYNMLRHLRPEKVGSWKHYFGRKFVVWKSNPFGATPVMLKNLPELKEKMSDVVFIRTHNSPDVNSNLPKERHTTFQLDMTPEQKKMYKSIKDDIISEIRGMEKNGIKASTTVMLAKIKRLEQVAIDPDMLKEDSKDINMNKLYPKEEWAVNTTVDHLNDPDNRGMVIFCDMKLPLDKVRQGLINNGVEESKIAYITGDVKPEERTKIQEKMKTGEVKVVLATSVAEEGVNLQHGAHTMIHLDIPWTPKSYTQRSGRIQRQGQPSSYTVFLNPVMKGTIEDRKREKLGTKTSVIEGLLGKDSSGSALNLINSKDEKSLSLQDIKDLLS